MEGLLFVGGGGEGSGAGAGGGKGVYRLGLVAGAR